ncbi:MAG: DUF2007 domain-containing protein [Draconibacterium sp.]|nr:DUF2007 domain-containing protein [Draconibacterium sp.]
MKLVTIKESHYNQDLTVLKSRLESEGIECRLKNELTTQVLNHIPAFSVELQIADTDLERAKEIMIETGELPFGKIKLVCQKCGSERVKMKVSILKKIQLFFSILFTLLGANTPTDKLFSKVKYVCKDCGAVVE